MSRNSPDAAETIIHVMEGMATSGGHGFGGRESLRDFVRNRTSHSRAERSGQQPPPNDNKEEENNRKKETKELNTTLAELLPLEDLWSALSKSLCKYIFDHYYCRDTDCFIAELDLTRDNHAFLVLQPAVEAFFMVHASPQEVESEKKDTTKEDIFSHISDLKPPTPATHHDKEEHKGTNIDPTLPLNTVKFIQFAEAHKAVLNQILRQSNTPLADGPFGVLTKHIKILDFDVKRRFFRQELDKIKERNGRGDTAIHVKRSQIFDDSFRELHRRTADEWKSRLYIVFDNEEGQDAGGLLREWYNHDNLFYQTILFIF